MSQSERKARIGREMAAVRIKTLRLFDSVPEEFLKRRVHDFYSPLGWHFGHIGMTEEYWTRHRALGLDCLDEKLSFLFANLPENPKSGRVHLPSRAKITAYLAATRERSLAALAEADLESAEPLLQDGYAWEFALQHECQHQETISELMQLVYQSQPAIDLEFSPLEPNFATTSMDAISGGVCRIGSNATCVYDNEKREYEMDVAPFLLDVQPVTAAQWVAFIADGGYERPGVWSEAGWEWRTRENVTMPEYWRRSEVGFSCYSAHGLRPIAPEEPACSLSWYEADAFARWAGKRLPTEFEWECVARGNPNLQMFGSVWQWTSSDFLPYPGFVAFPYDGYSKEHMDGKHKVCRGSSWASDPRRIARPSFRNWYIPSYRQGFLGLRCAR